MRREGEVREGVGKVGIFSSSVEGDCEGDGEEPDSCFTVVVFLPFWLDVDWRVLRGIASTFGVVQLIEFVGRGT